MPSDHRRGSRTPREASPPQLQDTVRLSATGIAKVLGDLEARVMRVVWQLGRPVPARDVYERVASRHSVAPLTVITVLNRLAGKGLVRRDRRGGLLHYTAGLSEPEFMARASRHVVEGVLGLAPEAVTASFVDVWADRDPERLAELGRIIQRRVREQARGEGGARPGGPPGKRAGRGRAG